MNIELTKSLPYAKAIFALALRDQQILEWQNMLNILTLVVSEYEKKNLLKHHKVRKKHELDTLYDEACSFPAAMNLIRLLAKRKKIDMLPNIAANYQQLLSSYKKTLEAKVITATELTQTQKEQLINILQQRYHHKVLLKSQVDNNLIGGATIHIAGQVIDGSIKGILHRLKQCLLAQETPC